MVTERPHVTELALRLDGYFWNSIVIREIILCCRHRELAQLSRSESGQREFKLSELQVIQLDREQVDGPRRFL
jgi:hypothetical protein